MRKLTAAANKISREELSLMAFSYAVHYHNLMWAAMDETLIIVEVVEAYADRRDNYFFVGDQIANNDAYYAEFLAIAADVNTAREIERAARSWRIIDARRAAIMNA